MKYISFQRFKDEILKADTPPKVTALSLGIGVSLALSPIPGLHILIAFILCKLVRLNLVVVLVGVLIHNPWTMIPIHLSGIVIGDFLLTGGLQSLEQFRLFPWDQLGLSTVFSSVFWQTNGPILLHFVKPFVLGHCLMSSIGGFSSYRLGLKLLAKSTPLERS